MPGINGEVDSLNSLTRDHDPAIAGAFRARLGLIKCLDQSAVRALVCVGLGCVGKAGDQDQEGEQG